MSILPTVHERLRAAINSNAGLVDRPSSPLVEYIRDDIEEMVERSRRFKVKARVEALQLSGPPRFFGSGRRSTEMDDALVGAGSPAALEGESVSGLAAEDESPLDAHGEPDVNIVQTHDRI